MPTSIPIFLPQLFSSSSMFSFKSSPSPKNFHSFQSTAMDSSSSSSTTTTNRTSPRSLQGPRPTPLKVRKDSYKINKKPPTIPQMPSMPLVQQQQQQQQPVIIYTVSPKILHTNPSDFMTLVQKLTGPNPHSVDSPSVSNLINSVNSALSPAAARFAAGTGTGTSKSSPRTNISSYASHHNHILLHDAATAAASTSNDDGMLLDRPTTIPGILSPLPSSLQPIPSSFFSPITSFDLGSLSFLNDLSPGVGGGGGGGNFMVSPTNLLSASAMTSPGWEFYSQFDL